MCMHDYLIFTFIDVIDHVPVDDNPAYITMKRITLKKNSAYSVDDYENINI